jgi:hypothetical protein
MASHPLPAGESGMPNSDQNSQSSSNEPKKRTAREAQLPQSRTKKQRVDNGDSVYPVSSISPSSKGGAFENPIDVDADAYSSSLDAKIFQRVRSKVATIDAYFSADAEDNLLVIADQGVGPYKFRLYTKDQYIKKNGPTDRKDFDNLRTIYRVPGDGAEYISRRQLYDIMEGDKADIILKQCGITPGKFPPYPSHSYSIYEYPSLIVRINGAKAGDEADFYGSLPQSSDDRVFDHMVDQFGRKNIWLQTRGVHYKDLDTYDRSEPWSDRGGFKLSIGWPKTIICDDDGRFIDLRRYCNDRGSANGSLRGLHGGSSSPNLPQDAVVFVLKKDGEGYMSPQRIKQQYPSSFGTLLEAAGLPRYVADRDQREGPNVLIDAGDHVFVSPDRIDHEGLLTSYTGLSELSHEPGHYKPEIFSLDRVKMAAAQGYRPIAKENISHSFDLAVGLHDAETGLALSQEAITFADGRNGDVSHRVSPGTSDIVKSSVITKYKDCVEKRATSSIEIREAEKIFTRKYWTDLDVDRSDMHRWILASRVDSVKVIGREKKLMVPPNKNLIPSMIYWNQETRDEYEAIILNGNIKQIACKKRERSNGRD